MAGYDAAYSKTFPSVCAVSPKPVIWILQVKVELKIDKLITYYFDISNPIMSSVTCDLNFDLHMNPLIPSDSISIYTKSRAYVSTNAGLKFWLLLDDSFIIWVTMLWIKLILVWTVKESNIWSDNGSGVTCVWDTAVLVLELDEFPCMASTKAPIGLLWK